MRKSLIKKHITKEMRGIEIAPWHSPIAAKIDGYKVEILDIFDADQLRKKCLADPANRHRVSSIEEVDYVASAVDIDSAIENAGHLGKYDYILSSHNFEHLPNPIKFLQACAKVLKSHGCLSMAIPSKNYTFDFFRGLTSTSDFFESYFENRTKPSPYSIYDLSSCGVKNIPYGPYKIPGELDFRESLEDSFLDLKKRIEEHDNKYIDTHVSVFTADSFNLIISELISLEIISFKVREIIDPGNFEFYVHLEKIDYPELTHHKLNNHERINLYRKVYGSVKLV